MALITEEKELANLRTSGKILAEALQGVVAATKPGVTSGELNQIAERHIRGAGAKPAFTGYQGYPASLCVSINHEVVHGIPDPKREIKSGDVVGLDLGVNFQGAFTDHAVTVAVGKVTGESKRLIVDTKQALHVGLDQVKAGKHVGDISQAIQDFLEDKGYGVVRQLTGHGVGRSVHEEPSVPNFGQAGTGAVLRTGMVLAIEPMVTLGDWRVQTLADGWTVETVDGSTAAHFEETIRVTDDGYELLTTNGTNSRN